MKLHTALLVTFIAIAAAEYLPTVDLGYEIHQAISYNATGQTYNFSNIRYAQPPVGDLRFAAPVPPTGRNSGVQNGSVGVICPAAAPAWEFIAEEFLEALVLGNVSQFNLAAAEQQLQAYLASNASHTPPDPRTTEDCLFLDVIVPQSVFKSSNMRHWQKGKRSSGAPVLVWIYGGGYTFGDKTGSGNPSGLIEASQAGGSEGIIFVALNYRLGALGWLSGPTLQGSGGVSNAGLYDQRLAIEWVKNNIHLFGGDPTQITLIGESAGGGSIEHQITAYGGLEPTSFQRAIMQSPGWAPIVSQATQENHTQTFLELLGVTSIAEARQLSSEQVITANIEQVAASPYGTYTYGPVVDGTFVPALPGLLLNAGAFAKNVSIMVGHNADEGALFTPPNVVSDQDLEAYLESHYPGIQPAAITTLLQLYPAVYDGTYPYTNGLQRTFLLVAESVFTCNTHYLNVAYGNNTHAYEFEIPPAFHGFDIPYTFYNGAPANFSTLPPIDPPIAEILQGYIVNFAMTGDPNGAGLPAFPIQGTNGSLDALTATGVTIQKDDTINERCVWWQKALYT